MPCQFFLYSKAVSQFLLLSAGRRDYQINNIALHYMAEQGLAATPLAAISNSPWLCVTGDQPWSDHLAQLVICKKAYSHCDRRSLLGSLLKNEAMHKLTLLNDGHRKDIDKARDEIWRLYAGLNAYKVQPTKTDNAYLFAEFERPEIPIHTNGSENDIREQALLLIEQKLDFPSAMAREAFDQAAISLSNVQHYDPCS